MANDDYGYREECPQQGAENLPDGNQGNEGQGYVGQGNGGQKNAGQRYDKKGDLGQELYGRTRLPRQNNLALLSVVMGIVGLLTICCYGGIIFGSLGLIFGILSRDERIYSTYARVGMFISAVGLIIGLALFFYMMAMVSGTYTIDTSPPFLDLMIGAGMRGDRL